MKDGLGIGVCMSGVQGLGEEGDPLSCPTVWGREGEVRGYCESVLVCVMRGCGIGGRICEIGVGVGLGGEGRTREGGKEGREGRREVGGEKVGETWNKVWGEGRMLVVGLFLLGRLGITLFSRGGKSSVEKDGVGFGSG